MSKPAPASASNCRIATIRVRFNCVADQVIQGRDRGIEPCVVIKNCPRAINVKWRAKFLGCASKIDIFAVKLAVAVMEKMHVAAAFVSSAEAKISGAWHKRLYNFSACYPSILKPRLRTAISATPTTKLVRTSFFPCLSSSPSMACAAR